MIQIKPVLLFKSYFTKTVSLLIISLFLIAILSDVIAQAKNNSIKKTHVQVIHFGANNHIDYNLDSGTYNIFFNGKEMVTDAYAACNAYTNYDSRNYTNRNYSTAKLNDINGVGTRHVITLSGNGQLQMQQVFYVYQNKEFFYAEYPKSVISVLNALPI